MNLISLLFCLMIWQSSYHYFFIQSSSQLIKFSIKIIFTSIQIYQNDFCLKSVTTTYTYLFIIINFLHSSNHSFKLSLNLAKLCDLYSNPSSHHSFHPSCCTHIRVLRFIEASIKAFTTRQRAIHNGFKALIFWEWPRRVDLSVLIPLSFLLSLLLFPFTKE